MKYEIQRISNGFIFTGPDDNSRHYKAPHDFFQAMACWYYNDLKSASEHEWDGRATLSVNWAFSNLNPDDENPRHIVKYLPAGFDEPMSHEEYNEAIKQSGITKTELADLLGVARRTIQRRTSGEAEVTLETTIALKTLLANL